MDSDFANKVRLKPELLNLSIGVSIYRDLLAVKYAGDKEKDALLSILFEAYLFISFAAVTAY
jgi:hypothetical protein